MTQYEIKIKGLTKQELVEVKHILEAKLGLKIHLEDNQFCWFDASGDLAQIYDELKILQVKKGCYVEYHTRKVIS